jgi:ribosomal protein L37E
MTVLIAALLPLFSGVGLFWLGRRGRIVGDHPYCRRCGFDLFGKPAESVRCAECGAWLQGRRAIRIGQRAPRGVLIWMGLFFLIPSLLGVGALVVAVLQGPRAASWKPAPWLALEVTSDRGDLRDAAISELSARITGHRISRWGVGLMARQILAAQADPRRDWDRKGWGSLIEQAHDEELLAPAD